MSPCALTGAVGGAGWLVKRPGRHGSTRPAQSAIGTQAHVVFRWKGRTAVGRCG